MKVVIFAGGLGTRMREETEFRPKPMIEIGGRPVLWHIMKVYAKFGFNEFVVCAGYKSHVIKGFFQDYASHSQDFTTTLGDSDSTVFHGENGEQGWKVTVADTGPTTQTGGRLLKVQQYIGDETFMCTYGDGIAPVNLPELLDTHERSKKLATMTVTRQHSRFGVVQMDSEGIVSSFREKPLVKDLISIGFFVFEPGIFQLLGEDSVLENEPLQNLAHSKDLAAYRHDGFWQPMDTYREFIDLNALWEADKAPWKIW